MYRTRYEFGSAKCYIHVLILCRLSFLVCSMILLLRKQKQQNKEPKHLVHTRFIIIIPGIHFITFLHVIFIFLWQILMNWFYLFPLFLKVTECYINTYALQINSCLIITNFDVCLYQSFTSCSIENILIYLYKWYIWSTFTVM